MPSEMFQFCQGEERSKLAIPVWDDSGASYVQVLQIIQKKPEDAIGSRVNAPKESQVNKRIESIMTANHAIDCLAHTNNKAMGYHEISPVQQDKEKTSLNPYGRVGREARVCVQTTL